MIAIISGQSSSCEIAVRVLSPICRFTEATFLLRFSVEGSAICSWAHRALDIDQGTAAGLPDYSLRQPPGHASGFCRCRSWAGN
jgi:hypothetical protein